MRTFHLRKNTLCLAADPPEGLQYYGPVTLEDEMERTIDFFLQRPLFRRLLAVYSHISYSQGHVLLKAHGVNHSKNWQFKDRTRTYNMQHWINRVDGTALAIFLFSCNPHHYQVSSQHSLVFHMDSSFTVLDLVRRRKPVRLYVPNVGYVDQDRRLLHQTIADLEVCIETPIRRFA